FFGNLSFFRRTGSKELALIKSSFKPFRPGRKIANSRKSCSLLFWEFIFFPKDWLKRTSLDKKFF
ncbi:hypothetical protein, partial [Carnobacterium maltaromaticum]|uniref:hypothetical protein n=1 Tax=Carnobacterium maltaromaticum TaxID=2751 RepID=UPI001F23465B